MRSSERKIFIIQIVSLIILLLNSIFYEFLGEIGIIIFLIVLLVLLHFVCGIAHNNMLTSKLSIKLCLFYSIAFLVLKYSLGMVTGFYKNLYDLSFKGILVNTIPVIIIILLEEICRFTINEKSGRNRLILCTNVLIFTLVDFSLITSFVGVNDLETFLKTLTTSFNQALFMNVGLSLISYKHGIKPALIYSFIFNLYKYFVPIVPGFSAYVETIVDMLIPILIVVLLHIGIPEIFKKKKNKEDIRDKRLITKLIGAVLLILILIVVSLNSNIFRYWSCVVGSGSMEPTINIGDIIIVDKSYSKNPQVLNKGDILVFKINDKFYTHRIIDVLYVDGEKQFITQGDREGQAVDDWIVTKNEIVGVTKMRLRYIGLPSIWLRDLMKGK